MRVKTRYIEISDEMESQIITQSLYESIEMMYDDIVHLSSRDENGNPDLQQYEKEDLKNHLATIEGLKSTYKYYTLHSEWSKLDRFGTIKLEDYFSHLDVDQEEGCCVLDAIKIEEL